MSIDNNDQQVAEPTVRLCMLRTWPKHFDGYGFNLHAEKSKTSTTANGNTTGGSGSGLPFSGGQYIGKVDRGSPAESAGLREGDRIVQVDGVDIEGETHSKVVARIKKGSAPEDPDDATTDPDNAVSRCSLLVVDRRADTYYKEKGIRVHSDMGLQVLVLRTPEDPTPECLSLQPSAAEPVPSPKDTSSTTVVDNGTKQQASPLIVKFRIKIVFRRKTFSPSRYLGINFRALFTPRVYKSGKGVSFLRFIFKIFIKKKINIILVKGYLGVGGQGLLEHRRMTREKRGRGHPHFLYNTL